MKGVLVPFAVGVVVGAVADASASGLLGAVYTLGADSQHILLFTFMFFGLAVIVCATTLGISYSNDRARVAQERIKAETALETERIKRDAETLRDHGYIGPDLAESRTGTRLKVDTEIKPSGTSYDLEEIRLKDSGR